MDMSFGDITSSLRLNWKNNAAAARAIPVLKAFMKENGIGTVFIRNDRETDGVEAAGLLQGDFRVVLECDASGYRRLTKKRQEGFDNVVLLPAFDISDPVSELKKIVALLPARKGPASLFIKNDGKLVDQKRIRKAFAAIMQAVGRKHVKFYWDCGFVLCAFSEEELGFFIQKGSEISFVCPSFVNVDAELNFHVCDKLKGRVDAGRARPGTSLVETANRLSMALVPYQSFGIYSKCGACHSFQKSCSGGCKASIMNGFR